MFVMMSSIIMVSPTGDRVRGDDIHGSGKYGALRGPSIHKGTDYVCVPGQDIVCPILDGVLVRVRNPYVGPYSGVLIRSPNITVTLFYMDPDLALIGQEVTQGQVIGKAQDIGKKYPGITPHIHLQVDSINPEVLI